MSLQQICSERRCENDKCVLRIAKVYQRESGSPALVLSHQSCSPMARSVRPSQASDLAQRLVRSRAWLECDEQAYLVLVDSEQARRVELEIRKVAIPC
jgi:hypothetical protein